MQTYIHTYILQQHCILPPCTCLHSACVCLARKAAGCVEFSLLRPHALAQIREHDINLTLSSAKYHLTRAVAESRSARLRSFSYCSIPFLTNTSAAAIACVGDGVSVGDGVGVGVGVKLSRDRMKLGRTFSYHPTPYLLDRVCAFSALTRLQSLPLCVHGLL